MDDQIFAEKPNNNEPWDVAIIGSGPSGLTAAIYTTRGAASTILLAGEKWGGQLMLTSVVDNFPGFPTGILGQELMDSMKKQAIRFGAEFRSVNVTKIEQTKDLFRLTVDGSLITARSVILATGAETKWLNVPREKDLIGRGISSCAPCDAPFFKEKDVLVVGGGDSAMEEALVLTKYAKSVTIIHRKDKFKASAAMQNRVFENPKVKVMWNMEAVEVTGEIKFEKFIVKNTKTGEISEIQADGLFVAIGHLPSSELVKDMLELDEKGFIVTYDGPKTKVPGLFVSGDVHDHVYKQAITAAGFGCQAAMDALSYLDKSDDTRQN